MLHLMLWHLAFGNLMLLSFQGTEDQDMSRYGLHVKVFKQVDPDLDVEWHGKDGDRVIKGTKFGIVTGSARSILRAERIALNFMQRMSGVATATAIMVDAVAVGLAGCSLSSTKPALVS